MFWNALFALKVPFRACNFMYLLGKIFNICITVITTSEAIKVAYKSSFNWFLINVLAFKCLDLYAWEEPYY